MPWLILLLLGGAGVAYVVVKGKQQQQIMPPNQAIPTTTQGQVVTNGQVANGNVAPASAAPTSTSITTEQPTQIVEVVTNTVVAIQTEIPIDPSDAPPTLPPFPVKPGRENKVYWKYSNGTWNLIDRQRNAIVPQNVWPMWLQI